MDDVLVARPAAAEPTAATRPSAPASSGCVAECHSGAWGLERLAPVWNAVVDAAGLTHPFATLEWTTAWWAAFGGHADLLIGVVRHRDTVVAIAPLMRARRRHGRWRSLDNAHTPRLDWALAADHRCEAAAALWPMLQELARTGGLELSHLPAESPTIPTLTRLAGRDGILVGLSPGPLSPRVDTRGTWDEYVERLSARHRRNMRTRLDKLARCGGVQLEIRDGTTDLTTALERGYWLEAAAWKHGAGTAIVDAADVRRFYTELAERTSPRGWLRLVFLKAGGERIAFAYALEYAGRLFVLKTGYDPAAARRSPGQLLFWHLIRHAFDARLAEVDLLGTFDDWKRLWTSEARRHCRMTMLGDSLSARIEHAVRFRAVPRLRRTSLYHWCRSARDRVSWRGRRHAD